MMNYKRILSAILAGSVVMLVSVGVYAGTCDINSCTARIKKIYTDAYDGTVYIQLDLTSSETSTLNCTLYGGTLFTLKNDASSPNFKEVYAQLLAAAHAGQPVELRAEDNSNGCTILYVTENF